MRNIAIKSLMIASTLALMSTPALAKFKTTIDGPVSSAVKIEVQLSEDMMHRANNLPKDLKDRGSVGLTRSGFTSNGFYGEKDLTRLTERLEERLTKQLTKRGMDVSDTAPTVLRVVVTDARNNRPTFTQLSNSPGLSFQSFGNGGAKVEATLVQAGGQELGTMSHSWYDWDIEDARFYGTWTDANRALDSFAKQAAKALAK